METNTYMVAGQTFELQHYGVKGMKWGVRRANKSSDGAKGTKWDKRKAKEEYAKLDSLKRDYKKATREYNRSFNDAYNRSGPHLTKKGRDADTQRWAKAYDKARDLESAKKAYKEQKKNVRKNATAGQKMGRAASKSIEKTLTAVGSFYFTDLMLTGGATTRAIVNTGKTAVKSTMSKIGDKMFDYTLLDAAGNVLKRYN